MTKFSVMLTKRFVLWPRKVQMFLEFTRRLLFYDVPERKTLNKRNVIKFGECSFLLSREALQAFRRLVYLNRSP